MWTATAKENVFRDAFSIYRLAENLDDRRRINTTAKMMRGNPGYLTAAPEVENVNTTTKIEVISGSLNILTGKIIQFHSLRKA